MGVLIVVQSIVFGILRYCFISKLLLVIIDDLCFFKLFWIPCLYQQFICGNDSCLHTCKPDTNHVHTDGSPRGSSQAVLCLLLSADCPWFLGDRRWIMFLCSHLFSDPKSLFSAVPKLKRNPCQMGTESFLTAPVVPKAWEVIVIPPFFWVYAPKIPSLWVFLLFNNCLSELLLSPGYGMLPKGPYAFFLISGLGY